MPDRTPGLQSQTADAGPKNLFEKTVVRKNVGFL